MKGDKTEPCVDTTSPPMMNRAINIGINQYFFLTFRKRINSKIIDITKPA